MSCAAAAAAVVAVNDIKPDLVLEAPNGTSKIAIFGVNHLQRQTHIAEYILQQKPHTVMVETGITPAHASMPGTSISCREYVDGQPGMFLRMFCQVAAQMSQAPDQALAPGGAWEQAKAHFAGEQLAYIASFAVQASVVFGDRPKEISYRRLWHLPTAQQYDEAYTLQSVANYREMLGEPPAPQDSGQQHIVDVIMMQEREAVMCHVLDDLAAQPPAENATADGAADAASTAGNSADSSNGGHSRLVVAVVGAAHLPGLKQLWDSGRWAEMCPRAKALSESPVMQAPPVDPSDMSRRGAGLKRGLMEATIGLSVGSAVLEDLAASLPPPPADGMGGAAAAEAEAYAWSSEMYCTNRMQLAALPRDLLARVCSGYQCDPYEAFAPFRAVRLSQGGPGWSEDVGMALRGLNFDL